MNMEDANPAKNSPKFIPFREHAILTGPGEEFPIPLAYKGATLYFGSLEHVDVPLHLQPQIALALDAAFRAGTFSSSSEGGTEVGTISVDDGGREREFEVALSLVRTDQESHYRVESIQDTSK
jgi:hypothetical protein